MPPKKSKDSKTDNKKRKLNEVDKTSTTTTTTTSDVGKKPALKRAKTQYTNYNSIITMPMGYPNTQEKPFVYEDKDDPPLIQLITIRRDVGLYMFSWLEASTMARCQSVSKDFYEAQEGTEGM